MTSDEMTGITSSGVTLMHIRTSFPYETTHEDVLIPLSDGTRLYARI
jgi:predicted acyl esterase